jgi:hypothetical protein
MRNIAINSSHSKGQFRKGKYKRHHAHATKDDEHDQDRTQDD